MNKFTLDKAGNYGEVRTVNGIKPDEHGNVEVGGSDSILYVTTHYDVAYDGTLSDVPFEQIKEAYLSGRPVVLDGYGFATSYVPDDRIEFTKVVFNSATDIVLYRCSIMSADSNCSVNSVKLATK